MTRKALTALALVLVAVALLAPATGQAATKAKTLGPAPQNSDCLSWNNPERGCYYGIIGGIDYSISPHIARVGEKLVGVSSGFGNDPWSWHDPPGVKVDECNPPTGGPAGSHAGTCIYTATSPTGGWRPGPEAGGDNAASGVFFGSSIHCCTIGTYIAGDYVAILGPDEYSIDGFVRDADGDPVTSGTVFIAGQTKDGDAIDQFATVDDTGYYNAQFEQGTYTVSGSSSGDSLCIASVKSQCIESKEVSPSSTVDFRRDGFAEVAGTVTDLEGRPVKGAAILVNDSSGGKRVADGETDAQGKYQVDLDETGDYRVIPVKGEALFEPTDRVVIAEEGKEVTADFKAFDPIKVEIESGFVREPGDDFLTRMTVANRSSTITVTDLAPVNAYGVKIAENAFPVSERGRVTVKQLIPLGGPQPSSLGPGESWSADIRFTAEDPGRVGVRAKFTGRAEVNKEQRTVGDSHDATISIEDPDGAQQRIRNALAAQAIELYLAKTAKKFRELWAKEARQTHKELTKKLSPADEKRWFGANGQLKPSKTERAMAMAMGVPAEVLALAVPKGNGKDLTAVDHYALYRGARAEADHEAWLDYYGSRLGKPAAAVYGAASNEMNRVLTTGPGEYVSQIGGRVANFYEAHEQEFAINKNAMIDAVFAKTPDLVKAAGESRTAIGEAVQGAVPLMEQEIHDATVGQHKFNNEVADLIGEGRDQAAGTMFARQDSAIMNGAAGAIADEFLFGGAAAAGVKVGGKVLKGGKAAVGRLTEMVDSARKGGAKALAEEVVVGSKTLEGLPSYFDDLPEEARVAIGMDQLRAMGGISGRDASIMRKNVAEVNRLAREKFGAGVTGELFARQVNPFEVVGGMAKVEVVGVKSVNPIDLLLGASPKSLGQPGIFEPRVPETLPKWHSYTKTEQIEIKERFKTRTSEFTERYGYAKPGGKMSKMKKAINDKVEITVHGQYAEQDRVYELALHAEKVDGTEILSYKHLAINGDVITSKVAPIGVDVDDIMWTDGKGGRLPAEVEDFYDENFDRINSASAKNPSERVAEPFHGQTLRRRPKSDLPISDFPGFAHYGLRQLNEAEAKKVAKEIADEYNLEFPGRKQIKPEHVLEEINGRYGRKAIRITENDVLFETGVIFNDP